MARLLKTSFLGLFIVVLALVGLHADPAAAKKPDVAERFIKPMPDYKKDMSEEDFLAATKSYHAIPYAEEQFEYNIRLPKDWDIGDQKVSGNFMMNDKLYTELNSFYSKPRIDGRSRIEIKTVKLDFNLTAKQWFIRYLLEGGYTTEAMVIHSDTKVEAMQIVMEQDETYVLHTIVELNGDKVIAVECYIPYVHWEEEKSLQAHIMDSFKLVNHYPQFVGEKESFQFLDIAEIKYPKKWKLIASPMRSVDAMSAKILNVRDKTTDENSSAQGNIDVTLVSSANSNSLSEEILKYKKDLESTGMLVGKKIANIENLKYNDSKVFAITEAYEGLDSSDDYIEYELWFSLIVAGNYYYFITLLTPSRGESYAAWSYNTQGYKAIVESLSPMAGAFLERAE